MKKIQRKILNHTIDFIQFGEHWYSNGYVNKEFVGLEKGLDYVIVGKNASDEWICTKSSGFCVNPNPITTSSVINEFTDWYTYENKPYFDLHLNNAGMFANKRYIYTAIVVKNMSDDEVKNIKCQVTFDNEVVVKDYYATSSNGYNDFRVDIPKGAKKILEVKFLNVLDENVDRLFVFPFHEVKWSWTDTNIKTLFNTKDNESKIVSNRMVAYNYITIEKHGLSLPNKTDFQNDFRIEKEKHGSTSFDQYWKTGKEDATGLDIEESVIWYSDRLLEWQNTARVKNKSPISSVNGVVRSKYTYFQYVDDPTKGTNTLTTISTSPTEDVDTLKEIVFVPLTLIIYNEENEGPKNGKTNIKSNDAMVLNPKTDDIKILRQEGGKITYNQGGAIYEANVEKTNTDEIYVSDIKHISGFNPNKQWRWYPSDAMPYNEGALKDAKTYVVDGWRYLDDTDKIKNAEMAFFSDNYIQKFEGSLEKVENAKNMFSGCFRFTFDLSSTLFSNIKDIRNMLYGNITGNIKNGALPRSKYSILELGITSFTPIAIGNDVNNGDWTSFSGNGRYITPTSIGNNSLNSKNKVACNGNVIDPSYLVSIGNNVLTNIVMTNVSVFTKTPKEIEYIGDNFLHSCVGGPSMFNSSTKLKHVGKGLCCGNVNSGFAVYQCMFQNCTSLEELPEDAFFITGTTDGVVLMNTFKGCSNVKTPLIPYIEKLINHYNKQGIQIATSAGCFNGCTSAPDYEEAMEKYPDWF